MKYRKSGFTLVEIMTVVALIAVLFVIFIPRINFANNKVRETGVQSDFRSYQLALEQVARQHSGFNTFTKTVDDAEVSDPEAMVKSINSYLDSELKITYTAATTGNDATPESYTITMEDPWGDVYRFAYSSTNNACYVVCDGSDKTPGTGSIVDDVESLLAGTALADDNANADMYALKVAYISADDGLSIQTVGFDSNIDS